MKKYFKNYGSIESENEILSYPVQEEEANIEQANAINKIQITIREIGKTKSANNVISYIRTFHLQSMTRGNIS